MAGQTRVVKQPWGQGWGEDVREDANSLGDAKQLQCYAAGMCGTPA
jgi:hypothetical protein